MRFLKDWTLPVAMVTGAAIYFLFALAPALGGVSAVMSPVFDAVLPWMLFLILFVTFCKVDFHRLRPTRWHLWVSMAQVLLVALLVGVMHLAGLQGFGRVLVECAVVCFICPTAAAAAVVTAKLDGDLEAMTGYTFISNLLASASIPFFFPIMEVEHANVEFAALFLRILCKVFMVLVLPMVLAHVVKHDAPRLQGLIRSKPDLGFYLWAFLLMMVTGVTLRNMRSAQVTPAGIAAIAGVSLLACVLQFAIGRCVGHRFGATVEAGQGLGQKNTSFAIWAASAYLAPLTSVAPGCYILWQNAVNSLQLYRHQRRSSRYASR